MMHCLSQEQHVPYSTSKDSDNSKVRPQQQRILLLHHAAKCRNNSHKCSITPHCHSMKVLWKHIQQCKADECNEAHCLPSKQVLSHYAKCCESVCSVCGPVRRRIKEDSMHKRDESVLDESVCKRQRMGDGGSDTASDNSDASGQE